ncbi:MAG TPA: entericidin A/B family lipoprotein [Macromonas sp.]|nr:entericidin A/B family lipoprotein [Macromonas sp.]
MKKITALLALCCLVALTGCNTMRGFGEDVQQAGSAIERSATK